MAKKPQPSRRTLANLIRLSSAVLATMHVPDLATSAAWTNNLSNFEFQWLTVDYLAIRYDIREIAALYQSKP
jgi:hypothetical protein